MAIKIYDFDFHMGGASASFEVNTDIFTEEIANSTLTFFDWQYDKEADPIDEVLKKYAMKAILIATFNFPVTDFVIKHFEDQDGFANVDGSLGIKLLDVESYEFDDYYLDMEIKDV